MAIETKKPGTALLKDDFIELKMDTPVFPQSVYNNLPEILKSGCEQFSSERERDIFLLSSLTVLSGAMPNVFGVYDKRKVYTPLYCMIVAPPASGKGVANFALNYINVIEQKNRERHKSDLKKYREQERAKNSTPEMRPVLKKMVIPANSSSAAFMKNLKNSDGCGIIFESEADTLSITLSKEWGNYSDVLRKSFHHEAITSSRQDSENDIEIDCPKLATLITGTLNQVGGMKLDDPVNGLQSRFLFYLFDNIPRFKDVSPYGSVDNKFNFSSLGVQYEKIYEYLRLTEHEFILSKQQWNMFNKWYQLKMNTIVKDHNIYASSLIARMAISSFRLLMILSTLRSFEGKMPGIPIGCSDKDMLICQSIIETLLQHSLSVFTLSGSGRKDETLAQHMEYFEKLPTGTEFTRKQVISLCEGTVADRTVDRILEKFRKNGLLKSPRFGVYIKNLES